MKDLTKKYMGSVIHIMTITTLRATRSMHSLPSLETKRVTLIFVSGTALKISPTHPLVPFRPHNQHRPETLTFRMQALPMVCLHQPPQIQVPSWTSLLLMHQSKDQQAPAISNFPSRWTNTRLQCTSSLSRWTWQTLSTTTKSCNSRIRTTWETI